MKGSTGKQSWDVCVDWEIPSEHILRSIIEMFVEISSGYQCMHHDSLTDWIGDAIWGSIPY